MADRDPMAELRARGRAQESIWARAQDVKALAALRAAQQKKEAREFPPKPERGEF